MKKFSYICYMEEVKLEIQERLSIGFALGWSYYGAKMNYPYNELIIYLGFISLNLKWQDND